MKKLTDEQLTQIKGGSSGWIAFAIVSATIFLSGIFQGYTHPKSCAND